jgi:hypothetical protein
MGRRKYMGSEDSDVVARDRGVFLRLLREDDIDDRYLSWFRDPLITRYLEAKNLTREEALEHLHYGQKEKLRCERRWSPYRQHQDRRHQLQGDDIGPGYVGR